MTFGRDPGVGDAIAGRHGDHYCCLVELQQFLPAACLTCGKKRVGGSLYFTELCTVESLSFNFRRELSWACVRMMCVFGELVPRASCPFFLPPWIFTLPEVKNRRSRCSSARCIPPAAKMRTSASRFGRFNSRLYSSFFYSSRRQTAQTAPSPPRRRQSMKLNNRT